MFKNVQNMMDKDSVQVCRLCLAEEDDLIHIFNPKGYQGLLLWEIIEELLQMEVSKKDGLPWTICECCIGKVKDFKDFKTTCIKAKISYLIMIANRGLVEPTNTFPKGPNSRTSKMNCNEVEVVAKKETPLVSEEQDPLREVKVKDDMDTEKSLSDTETCSKENLFRDEFTCTGVPSDAALSDPLDLTGVKEDSDADGLLLEAVTCNQENAQHIESLDVGPLNVVCLPLEMGECPTDEEEIEPWESLAGDEAHEGDSPVEDYSRITSVTNVLSVPHAVGDMVDGCSIGRGSTQMCEETVSELRDGRNKNTEKKFERNTSLSALPGERSLRTVKKFSAKKGESLKLGDCIASALKLNDMMPSEGKHLDSHKKQLAGCTSFICDHCGIKYTDKKMLLIHVGGHISRNRPSTSVMSSLKCIQSRVTGIQSSKLFKCEMCGKEFKLMNYLTKHYAVHSNLKPFKCETCRNVFKRKNDLLKHSKIHLDSKLLKCDCCGKGFTSMSALSRHLVMHSDLRPFKCETCEKGFTHKSNLDSHSVIHSSLRPYKCDTCGRGFKRKTDLCSHLVIHSFFRPFKCDTCGKGFARKSNLVRHSVMHSGLRPYKCDTCGKGFARKSALETHSLMHSGLRPYKCDTCGKGFTQKSTLDTHSLMHSGLRPFKCYTCGKGFIKKSNLVTHLVIHSGLRPFRCDTCGREFSQKGHLDTHSVMHNSLRAFKCETCGKDFKRKKDLRSHLVMHSGLRPFRCDTCGREFSQKRILDAHLVIHSSFRPFKCETCGKGFARKYNLVAHSVIHSGLRSFKCDTCGKGFSRKCDLVSHSVKHRGF